MRERLLPLVQLLISISLFVDPVQMAKCPQRCGMLHEKNEQPSFRIVEGKDVDRSDAPFAVRIAVSQDFMRALTPEEQATRAKLPRAEQLAFDARNVKAKNLMCTGSLISNLHVLTNSHCFYVKHPFTGEFVQVKNGSVSVWFKKMSLFNDEVPIRNYSVHPDYSPTNKLSDVAVIRLKEPVHLSAEKQSICLAANTPPNNKIGTVYGYGKHYRKGANGKREPIGNFDQLRSERMDLKSREECKSKLPFIDSEREFCAVGETGGILEGDSGSPLAHWFTTGNNKRINVQLGVARGAGTEKEIALADGTLHQSTYHDRFEDVSHHCAWIVRVTGDVAECIDVSELDKCTV